MYTCKIVGMQGLLFIASSSNNPGGLGRATPLATSILLLAGELGVPCSWESGMGSSSIELGSPLLLSP